MKIIDEKFLQTPWRFVLQALLVGLVAYGVVFFIGILLNDSIFSVIGASSVASSLFIAFMTPHAPTAQPRRMVGGYIASILLGIFFHSLLHILWGHFLPISPMALKNILGGVAVGCIAFIMVVFNLEHPPAVGITLGLALGDWDLLTVLVVAVTITGASLIRSVFKPWLQDLL